MLVDLPMSDRVTQLQLVGTVPGKRLIAEILEQGPTVRAELLRLATSSELLIEPMPRCMAPLHALRLLGELAHPELIEPLLALVPVPLQSDDDEPAATFAYELPHTLARVGAAGIEPLWAIADDPGRTEVMRTVAVTTLGWIATLEPQLRDQIIAAARERLVHPESDLALTTAAAIVIAELGDAASYRMVMDAYRAGRINQQKAPAAAARQFLLGGGRSDLQDVHRSFWERYDDDRAMFEGLIE
jgi:hypothetical protein